MECAGARKEAKMSKDARANFVLFNDDASECQLIDEREGAAWATAQARELRLAAEIDDSIMWHVWVIVGEEFDQGEKRRRECTLGKFSKRRAAEKALKIFTKLDRHWSLLHIEKRCLFIAAAKSKRQRMNEMIDSLQPRVSDADELPSGCDCKPGNCQCAEEFAAGVA
jgi:hypothetical protein